MSGGRKYCKSRIKPWKTEGFCIINREFYILADGYCNTSDGHRN